MIQGQENLKLHYTFDNLTPDQSQVIDETGNGNNGSFYNGAGVEEYGDYNVLNLGTNNGYLNMGAGAGSIIATLEDFTISTSIFINSDASISDNGNFIWAFGNSSNMASDQNGGMFINAKNTRYAISLMHWSGEQTINPGTEFPKGEWKHLVYTQSGNEGAIYLNGEMIKSGAVTLTPSELGVTTHNYLGKSLYSGDAYLKNTLISDFKIINETLSLAEIKTLASDIDGLNQVLYTSYLEEEAAKIDLGDLNNINADIDLPLVGDNGIVIQWTSSNEDVISNGGAVTRPEEGESSVSLTLTAELSLNGISYSKDFAVTVIPYVSDLLSVQRDAEDIVLEGNLTNLRTDLSLPVTGTEGSVITWESANTGYLSDNGEFISLAPNGGGKIHVVLTAIVSKGQESAERDFDVYIAEDEGYEAYLFSYFTGNYITQEAIRFAVSYDGYNYRALNNNEAVVSSSEISSTGGVRDPHILRGPDGNYYMVVTDMVSANGWSSNRAMVLLKSSDLISWQSTVINIQEKYEGQEDLLRVWAPQTIYDAVEEKFMVYWSMKHGDGPDIIYYAYTNASFTDLEGEPQQLFYHPDNLSCIDGDIILKDGLYHLFFKTEGSGNGIKKAVSDNLTSGYELYDHYLQQTTEAVEGSSVFKLINQDNYILMYDMYSSGKYQFTISDDLYDFSIIDDEVSMNFHPRHGTVIPITRQEAERLAEEWATVEDLRVLSVKGDHIVEDGVEIDHDSKKVTITVESGTDLQAYDPQLKVMPGVVLNHSGVMDFSNGAVSYTLSVNGLGSVIYSVEVKSTSTDIKIVNNNSDSYKLYPNPACGEINVVFSFDEQTRNCIRIYDCNGKCKAQEKVYQEHSKIDINKLSPDLYVLSYFKDNQVVWSDRFYVAN